MLLLISYIARAVISADDPSAFGALFRRMFGDDSVRQIDGGLTLGVGLSRFDVVSHSEPSSAATTPAPPCSARAASSSARTRTAGTRRAGTAAATGRISISKRGERS